MATITQLNTDNFPIVANTYVLPPGHSPGGAQTVVIGIDANGGTFSLTVRKSKVGSAAAAVACLYKSIVLNGAAGTETFVATAITGTSIISLPTEGQQVHLVVASQSVAEPIVSISYHAG